MRKQMWRIPKRRYPPLSIAESIRKLSNFYSAQVHIRFSDSLIVSLELSSTELLKFNAQNGDSSRVVPYMKKIFLGRTGIQIEFSPKQKITFK